MRVLAIDPGYERLGIAVIEKNAAGKETLVYSDCFRTSAKKEFATRLLEIGNELERVIQEYAPTTIAVERLYFTNNQKTAMQVAEVRGVITYLGAKHGLTLFEYTPMEIKQAVSGYGKGNKGDVARMIPKLIEIRKDIRFDDEYDAIAIGLTCTARERSV